MGVRLLPDDLKSLFEEEEPLKSLENIQRCKDCGGLKAPFVRLERVIYRCPECNYPEEED
jgi:hypothetical protein